uniref:Uncharacterized protein n=1 Tax=Megaselia scalaris TaxID=36166 RepID=T1GBS3_MEGSC
MYLKLKLFAFLALYFTAIVGEVQKCHFGDLKCIETTASSLVKLGDGSPEMNLPDLHNFNFNGLRFLRNGDSSPIEADLRIIESNITGISGMKASNAKGFGKDLKGPHSITFKSKSTTLLGLIQ